MGGGKPRCSRVVRGAGRGVSHALQVALEVRLHGRVADGPNEAVGSRESSATQDVCRGEAQG